MYEVRFTVSKQRSLIVGKFEDIRLISSQLEQISSVIYLQSVCSQSPEILNGFC